MKKMTYEMALSNICAKFSSGGNNIGVERATVTAEEWEAIDTHLSAHSRHVLPKLRDLSLCVTEYQRTLDEGWNMCVREMQAQQAAQHEDEAVAEIEYIDDDGVTVKWLSNVVEGQKLYANPHPRMELTAEWIMRIYDEQIAKGGSTDNVIINTVRAAISRKGHE